MEMAFMSPSPMELMVIAVIALIVLGPSRLPEAARSVGRGMREMRNSFQGVDDDGDDGDGSDRSPPVRPPEEPEGGGGDSLDDVGGDGSDGEGRRPESVGAGERSS
jgi:sec-independent protein translocase protein TatA